ncbi:MAG: hypothetical protein AAF917_01535 [Pseudomonadota bacterium]
MSMQRRQGEIAIDTDSEATPKNTDGGIRPARLLAESAAIFLSVLLAFFVEQWREDQNELQEAEAAISLVRAELAQNLAELERVAPSRDKQLQVYIEAMGVLQNEGRFPYDLPRLDTPEITTIAYDLATDSGAVTTVSTDELLLIAKAYEALDRVQGNDDFLQSRNAQIRFGDGEQYISGFIYYVNQASANEPNAIEHVRKALELLTPESPGDGE